MAGYRAAPLPLSLACLLWVLSGCEAFYAIGPNGCDEAHACRSADRPRCDLMTRRCMPPAGPGGQPGSDGGPPCKDHRDCLSGVCDELGLSTKEPGRCLPDADVAVVRNSAELREALPRVHGLRLTSGLYPGDWVLTLRPVVLVGPQARSAAAEPAVLQPVSVGDIVLRVSNQARVMLDGIVVRGGRGASAHGIFCETPDSRLALRRSEVSKHEGRGIWARCPVWITQSRIGGWYGHEGNKGGGLVAEDAVSLTNSFVTFNGGWVSSIGGVALFGDRGASRLFAHISFIHNVNNNHGAAVHCGGAMVTIWRSLFWKNEHPAGYSPSGGSCLVYASAHDDLELQFGESVMFDVGTTPRFRSDSDFHLLPGSAAQDTVPKGEAGPILPVDYDGEPRPQGAGFDFGADEVPPA